ncbi:MAG: 50S ribosomal protein L25/general stress protein Ctc [Halanaerobiales bacterium]
MERYEIKVETREETGKGVARRLRREGKIPGVIYGKNRDPKALIVDPLDINKRLFGNAIFELTIIDDEEKEEELAMIKDYQRDVIKDDLLHVDFQHISMDEKISVTVPIHLEGSAPGVKEGGVLQKLMRELEIEAFPGDIPEEIVLDISELNMGDSLQVSDLEDDEDIGILSPYDNVIVTVVAPSEEITEEDEEEIEEEFIEPEVIGEEDEEEEIMEEEEVEREEE